MKSTCQHFARYRDEAFMRQYALLCARIVFPTAKIDVKTKARVVRCGKCTDGGRLNSMLCCCYDCATFGCLTHIRPHFIKKNHCYGVSTTFGELYCFKCNDFIFDHNLEKTRRYFENMSCRRLGLGLKFEWNPGRDEVRLFRKFSPLVHRLMPNSTRGLRGLVNLGNSCFMNCIIQALIHIPMLRDYFLTDQHNCKDVMDNRTNKCLMCELSNVVQEFYCGINVPFVPHRLLHMVWTHAQHLAGYEQHDAHEFFISALNILHKHAESASMYRNPNDCQCIIDRLFTGQLQSDLSCNKCGRLSTTVEPYWDISLQLNDCASTRRMQQKSNSVTPTENLSRSSDVIEGTPGADDESSNTRDSPASSTSGTTPSIERSLEECLENYVKCEKMEVGSKIRCDKCGSYEESVKQLTLRKLPMVICFHLKRFEHLSSRKTEKKRRKIRARVRFPEYLDMTPYTTAYRDSCRLHENILEQGILRQGQTLQNHSYPTRQQQKKKSLSPTKKIKSATRDAGMSPPKPQNALQQSASPTKQIPLRMGCGSTSSATKLQQQLKGGSSPTKLSLTGQRNHGTSKIEENTMSTTQKNGELSELLSLYKPSSSARQLARLANRYTLMAVVNHNGTTDSGHYSCHIRHQHSDWYNCNDHIISRERVEQALDSEGYLLFYCKMFIDYE